MRKRSAFHSSDLADHGVSPVATLVAQLASPLVAAFAGGFLGCLVTLVLTAIGVMSSLASASTTAALCGAFLITRTARCLSGAFFPALYGGTFGGMTSVASLTHITPSHSVTLTVGLFVALSIVCGFAFLVATRVDARSVVPIASGYGGRLGMIAAVASLFFIDLAQRLLGRSLCYLFYLSTGRRRGGRQPGAHLHRIRRRSEWLGITVHLQLQQHRHVG